MLFPKVFNIKTSEPKPAFWDPCVLRFNVNHPKALLELPEVLSESALSPNAEFEKAVLLLRVSFPNEVLPKLIIPDLILFLLKIKSILSVVPIKFVAKLVPALPVNDHAVGAIGACHVAFPRASDVNTFPIVAPVVTCKFVVLVFPATSSFSVGTAIPIPTLPVPFCKTIWVAALLVAKDKSVLECVWSQALAALV